MDNRNPSPILDKLLKFQSMTSLLEARWNASPNAEQSQRDLPLEDLVWNVVQDVGDDQSLLSALATLLVQDNEVVTVTTMFGGKIVACSHAGYGTSSMLPKVNISALEGKSSC
jgi:hypothetical protein